MFPRVSEDLCQDKQIPLPPVVRHTTSTLPSVQLKHNYCRRVKRMSFIDQWN